MSNSLPKTEKLVSISEAAKILGVSIDTLRRWDKSGKIHSQRVGKNRYFSIEDLENSKFGQGLPISEAAKQLGISATTLRRLEKKGLIAPERNSAGERVYKKENLEKFLNGEYFLRQKSIEEEVLEPLAEPEVASSEGKISHKVLARVQEEVRIDVARLKHVIKAISLSGFILISLFLLSTIAVTISFLALPEQTAQFFGYPHLARLGTGTNVLGAQYTGSQEGKVSGAGVFLKPLSQIPLGIVKQIDEPTYQRIIPPKVIEDVNEVVTIDSEGNLAPTVTIKLLESSYLQIPDSALVNNLNAEFLGGKTWGTGEGELAYFGADGNIQGLELPESNTLEIKSDSARLTVSTLDNVATFSLNTSGLTLDLAKDVIKSDHIKDGEVKSGDIADNEIGTGDLSSILTFSAGDFLDLSGVTQDSTSPQGLRLPNTSTSPSSPSVGEGYLAYDSANNQLIVYNGSAWTGVGGITSLNSLIGALNIVGAGINTISASGTSITVTGTEADTLSSVTSRGASTTAGISVGSLTSTGAISASNFSGISTGTNSGDNAVNTLYSGLAASKADVGQTFYIGTTQLAINRASASQTLAGLTLTTPDLGTPTVLVGTNITGTAAGLTAGSAAILATPRAINGVNFDGSQAITITAAAGTLTGTTLATDITTSSLTSVGTLTNLTVTNPITGSISGSSGSTTGNAATVTNGVYTNATNTLSSASPLIFSNTSPVITLGAADANGTFVIKDSNGTPNTLLTLTDAGTTGNLVLTGTIGASNFSGVSSGTNTGDQTITLSGDVSGSGTGGITATIGNNKVTGAMIALGSDVTGDIMYHNGTDYVRLAGASGFLKSTGASAPSWSSVTQSDVGLSNVENTALSTWAGSASLNTLAATITSGPTTLSGYGITDALSNSATSVQDAHFGDIYLKDDTSPSHYLQITNLENLTGAHVLSISVGNTDRTLTIAGDTSISGTNTGDQTSVSGNAGTVTIADAGSDTTTSVLLGTSATGSLAPATDSGLTYNASTDTLTATAFSGPLTGNITGNVSGTAATVTGAAQTAITSVGNLVSGTVLGSQTFTTNNIVDSGALTIKTTTSSALTLDSGTTGTVNLGTGNNAKTINVGTGTAGNAINIGTNNTTLDTINIGSSLDDVEITGDQWSITNAGVLTVQSCTGCGGGGATLDSAYTTGNTIGTDSGSNVIINLAEVATPTELQINNQDTAGTNAVQIDNTIASGTLTNGLYIEQSGAGTMTNAIQIAETAGTITDGILITGTLGNILNSASIDITGAGAITGATGITSATGNVAITAGDLTLNGTTRISNAGVGTFVTGTVLGSQTFTTNNIVDSGALTITSTTSALTLDSGSGSIALSSDSLTGVGTGITANAGLTINTAGTTGTMTLRTADQSAGSTNSTAVNIITGNAAGATSTAGNIVLDVGTSTTSNGSILIGTAARAQTISIGTNATGGVITIGSATNTGLALTDAQWSVTDAGAAAFASVSEGGTGLSAKYAPISADFVTVAANGTLTGETAIGSLTTAISTTSTLNVDGTATIGGLTVDTDGSLAVSNGTFTTALTTTSAQTGATVTLTNDATTAVAQFGMKIISAASSSATNGVDALLSIDNADNLAATAAIIITQTGGVNYTNLLDTPSLDISGTGAITGATGVSTTTVTASDAIAANGGITFDAGTDTVGAFTMAGNIIGGSFIITDIGSTGTDFTANGALAITLDGAETALSVDNAANASSIFVAEDNNVAVFTIADGGVVTATANINANGGLDVDDAFVVADGGAVTANTDVTFALAETEDFALNWSVSGTQAGQAQVIIVTNSSSSGNQYGLKIDNAPSTGTTDALVFLDNSDTDTVVTSAIQISNTARFTNILDIGGTTLTATEINRLDGKDAALVDSNDSPAAGDISGSFTDGLTITDNSVDGTDIAIASQAAGDLMYYDGTDWVRLAVGLSSECLKGGTTPVYGACGSGSQTPWTSDIDADNFSLLDFGTGITARAGLTIATTTTGALTLDSGTTGTINLGTGNNAKTIAIGTGTAGNIINIGTNNTVLDTITIGSALDDVAISSDSWSVTNAGAAAFVTINGLTITTSTGTLTVANGKTLTANNTLTFAGTDSTTITFQGTDTYVGRATTDTLTNKTIGSTGLVFSGATTDIDTAASEGLTLQGRAASSFNTTSGNISFQAAGTATSANVQIGAGGAGSTTPDLLVLDVKSDAEGALAGTNGAMYYNASTNKFRCYQNSAWTDCIGTGGSGVPKESHVIFFTESNETNAISF